jgi:hypothetical protein
VVSVALRISEELKKDMGKLPWINWSEIAREEALSKIREDEEVEEFRRIVAKSKLTQEQADKLADEASWALAKRYEKLLRK